MHPSDDPFYARLLTLPDAELFHYIQHYSRYKVDAVHAAIAELRTRGVPVSQDALSEIARYFMRQEAQRTQLCHCDPRWLRWLSYAIFTLGLGSAVLIYVTASPPPQYPLGYDPFASKKYLRELELYGGKINILAVECRQWFDRLWQGQNLSYTIAFLTVILSYIFWFIGSHSALNGDPHSEKQNIPSDARSLRN
jgi:hypothetical protein